MMLINSHNAKSSFDNGIALVRNATPVLELIEDDQVLLTLDNITHTFTRDSAVAQNTKWFGIERVQQRFNESTLFVQNDDLIDYRYKDYNGIVHSDDSIKNLIEHVGTSRKTNFGLPMLSSDTSPFEVHLAKEVLGLGGESHLNINFGWSPFMTNLRSLIEHIRLMCSNGAKLRTPILQNQIPIINDWQRHLLIASSMLKNRTEAVLSERMVQMYHNRAPLSLVRNIREHASARADEKQTPDARKILLSADKMLDVVAHSGGKITQAQLDSVETRWADRCPTHVSLYTLFNLATEIDTHTAPAPSSSSTAVGRTVNQIVFNESKVIVDRHQLPSAFNDPEAALMHHQMH